MSLRKILGQQGSNGCFRGQMSPISNSSEGSKSHGASKNQPILT